MTIYQQQNHARCPVAIIWKYHSKLPPNCKNSALYLRPKPDNCVPGHIWYHDIPIGVNKLQSCAKDTCKEAGFSGHYTNHSLRSTSATRMYESGINEQTICTITGHRSNVVRTYKRTRTNESMKHKAAACIPAPELSKKLHKTLFEMHLNDLKLFAKEHTAIMLNHWRNPVYCVLKLVKIADFVHEK